jgi:hypothetical protein
MGVEITKTELPWPGKYNEDGTRTGVARVSLPFQLIETINESRATREVKSNHSLAMSALRNACRYAPYQRNRFCVIFSVQESSNRGRP